MKKILFSKPATCNQMKNQVMAQMNEVFLPIVESITTSINYLM